MELALWIIAGLLLFISYYLYRFFKIQNLQYKKVSQQYESCYKLLKNIDTNIDIKLKQEERRKIINSMER